MTHDGYESHTLSGMAVDNKAIFERVQSAYDLALLAKAHVVIVGTGGAAGLVDDLARTGIGRLTLIDKDQVSVENLATQQTYAYDIHVSKAQAIASRLRYINPSVAVTTYAMPVEDLDDAEFAPLLERPPAVLVGCTDNFYAQARIHRLSLQFGIPCLCAQLWHEGRGGEITLMHPDIVPSACHRCMLVARYKAYLEDGFVNDVTSHASPIFAASRINSLAGHLVMALLHHGTNQPRYGSMFSAIGNRTLVLLRMDPCLQSPAFNRVFANADTSRLFFDEVVWSPQLPEPNCPDCGGTGNLLGAKGTFADTRMMML